MGRWDRTRRIVGRAQWLLVPLLVLGLAEVGVRFSVDRVPMWYGAAERVIAARPVRVLFVGSSRVQAAILPSVFEATMAERGRPGMTALNLARGYSTDAEHYLGLRDLLSAHPEHLRGVTVFAEAFGGLPFPTQWDTTPWAMAEQPWLLVDLLHWSDLPTFWLAPGFGFDTRLHISLRVLLRRLALFNRRERVREQWFDILLPALSRGHIPEFAPDRQLGDDLEGPEGMTSIRTDPAALAVARQLARSLGEQMARYQMPMREWRGTIPEDLVRLVGAAGGHVAFLEPPLSDVFRQAYRSPMRRHEITVFARQAQQWGACVVRPDFRYSDDDLPDLWHLKPERAADYTRAVAEAWLESCPEEIPP